MPPSESRASDAIGDRLACLRELERKVLVALDSS